MEARTPQPEAPFYSSDKTSKKIGDFYPESFHQLTGHLCFFKPKLRSARPPTLAILSTDPAHPDFTELKKKESRIVTMNRKERRAAAHIERKLARKAGFPSPEPGPPPPTPAAAGNPIPNPSSINPKPSRPPISEARLNANRANSQFSSGAVTPAGREASSQNRTLHGLARHNGAFKLLATEDHAGFEALKASIAEEHQPATTTESILINEMAQSHWLAARALNLQHACFDLQTGQITDTKLFALYLRYQTTHSRAFDKALNQLLKLRAERRKEQVGFEAHKPKNPAAELKKRAQDEQSLYDNPEFLDLGTRLGQASLAKDPAYWTLLREFDDKFGFGAKAAATAAA